MKCIIKTKHETIDDVGFFEFSGGEVHIKIPEIQSCDRIDIIAFLEKSCHVMGLLMITDAIKRQNNSVKLRVILPYLPYARQDKISDYGESLSLAVFSNIINSQNYNSVVTYDVHSDTSIALINNLKSVSQLSILQYANIDALKNKILVSPDFGSSKKTRAASKILNSSQVIQADKSRDKEGNIVGIDVFCNDLNGSDVVIVDDICDGGKTFIELAKSLKRKNSGNILLFVTHGIFSKGVDVLFSNGISEIYTTNTFTSSSQENVKIINVVGNLL